MRSCFEYQGMDGLSSVSAVVRGPTHMLLSCQKSVVVLGRVAKNSLRAEYRSMSFCCIEGTFVPAVYTTATTSLEQDRMSR